MNFCPQCGTRFEPDARFCQECGFDINTVIKINELIPNSVIQPPVVETTAAPPQLSEIITTAPESVRSSSFETTKTSEPLKQPKRKKFRIWAVLVIVVLVAVSWLGYNMYFPSGKGTPVNVGSNIIFTENPTNEQPQSNTKSMSLMDQELAKQKVARQNQITINDVTNQDDVESNNNSENEIIPKVILEVGHKEEPKNKNPKNPSKLTLQKATMITKITTDHYNDGMGTPRGGKIIIKTKNGEIIGSYKALGMTGKNGTPSAKWVVEPNIMLEKGTYFISDSEPSTWSKTFVGGNGFLVVQGYEIE